jgi:hypothetical protein
MLRIADLLPERYHGVYASAGISEDTTLAD